MRTGTITVQEFVAESWVDGVFNRFQCLNCGTVFYTESLFRQAFKDENDTIVEALESEIIFEGNMACRTPQCQSKAIPVSDNLSEIVSLFALCSYEIAEAYERATIELGDYKLFICLRFHREYVGDVFPNLPAGWQFDTQSNSSFIEFDISFRDLSEWEQEILRDDILQALYDWISSIHKCEKYKIWQLAGLLSYNF